VTTPGTTISAFGAVVDFGIGAGTGVAGVAGTTGAAGATAGAAPHPSQAGAQSLQPFFLNFALSLSRMLTRGVPQSSHGAGAQVAHGAGGGGGAAQAGSQPHFGLHNRALILSSRLTFLQPTSQPQATGPQSPPLQPPEPATTAGAAGAAAGGAGAGAGCPAVTTEAIRRIAAFTVVVSSRDGTGVVPGLKTHGRGTGARDR
jgi:hypothetical protein